MLSLIEMAAGGKGIWIVDAVLVRDIPRLLNRLLPCCILRSSIHRAL